MGWKIQAREPVKKTSVVFFLSTSRKRYVPSVEPATRRLSSGHSPKPNPSSVSHNPRRAVMGHPSISCTATQVQRERKGHKGTFIIPPEYHDVPSQVALTDWTGRGPLALSVLLASTPGLHWEGWVPGPHPRFSGLSSASHLCTKIYISFPKTRSLPNGYGSYCMHTDQGSTSWGWNRLGDLITSHRSSKILSKIQSLISVSRPLGSALKTCPPQAWGTGLGGCEG